MCMRALSVIHVDSASDAAPLLPHRLDKIPIGEL